MLILRTKRKEVRLAHPPVGSRAASGVNRRHQNQVKKALRGEAFAARALSFVGLAVPFPSGHAAELCRLLTWR